MQPTKACFLPRHRPSTYPVCVAAQNPHFWPGTPSRHRRNKGMVSVVAEKEFRIPNTKYTFPINAGRTGRRLSGSSGSFCCLSVLNDNGGLFRQTGAQRPRAGVSVGHTDVRHSLISAVGAHLSASGGVCGGSLCASLAAGRIGSSHPLLALIRIYNGRMVKWKRYSPNGSRCSGSGSSLQLLMQPRPICL